jgi:diguanylate cyclase (GGDEF)-like protein
MLITFLRPKNLSQKMLRVIFSIYLVVTCVITSLQFISEYVKTQNAISSELQQLQQTVVGPIATSLWQYNRTQLESLITGLVKMPIIEGVDVLDKQEQILQSRRSFTPEFEPLSMFETKSQLTWQLNNEVVLLGSLVLYSSSEIVLDRVMFGFSLIALTAIVKLSLLFWLFLWAFDRYLASPLKELMTQVDNVQLNDNVNQRISLTNVDENELKQLQNRMNTMLEAIQSDRKKLLEDEQNKRIWLEKAVAKRTEELQKLNEQLANLATRDSLTGILNRGSFFDSAQQLLVLGQRQKSSGCLILLDLDHFKDVNDTYGHFIGDKVLMHFTMTMQSFLRESDLVGRLGGEEFGIYLNNTKADDALELANKLRKTIADSSLKIEGNSVTYTVSLGIESSQAQDQSINELFKRADVKLYSAKNKGRNRVEV